MAYTNRVIRKGLIKKLFTKSRQDKEKLLGMFSLLGSAQWGGTPLWPVGGRKGLDREPLLLVSWERAS